MLIRDDFMTKIDEAQEDFDREYRLAQRALQRKRIEIPTGKVMRYEFTYDQSEDLMCDKVWIYIAGGYILRLPAFLVAGFDRTQKRRVNQEAADEIEWLRSLTGPVSRGETFPELRDKSR